MVGVCGADATARAGKRRAQRIDIRAGRAAVAGICGRPTFVRTGDRGGIEDLVFDAAGLLQHKLAQRNLPLLRGGGDDPLLVGQGLQDCQDLTVGKVEPRSSAEPSPPMRAISSARSVWLIILTVFPVVSSR